MTQILLIFRKDCRRFWPEILVVLAITAAFVWLFPSQWRIDANPMSPSGVLHLDLHHVQILAQIVAVLWPISWLVLIARVVHDENLIGERQFWVTRPYFWHSLLGAKLAFGAVFVCLPFLCAQVALLVRAGFAPGHFVVPLAYSLLLIVEVLILPLFALAAATPSLLRIIVVLVGLIAVIAAAAFFFSSSQSEPSMWLPYSMSGDEVVNPLFLAFSWAIVLTQYTTRKLWISGIIFLVFVAVMVLVAASPFDQAIFDRTYTLLPSGAAKPIAISVSPDAEAAVNSRRSDSKYVYFEIPVEISGIAPGQEFQIDNVRMTIDSVDGSHWVSPWSAVYNQRFVDDSDSGSVGVVAGKEFFKRANAAGVTLHVELAVTQLEAGPSRQIGWEPDADLSVPSIGLCTNQVQDDLDVPNFSCRTAFHSPPLARVASEVSAQPCAAAGQEQAETRRVAGWVGANVETPTADVSFTPVGTETVNLKLEDPPDAEDEDDPETYALCPGAPIVVTPYRLVRRFQYRMELRQIGPPPPQHL